MASGFGRTAGTRWPATFWIGLAVIGGAEALLMIDLAVRGGAVPPEEALPPPAGWGGRLARVAATDFTPIVWTGFLLAADGLLEGTGRSPLRARPRRFALCWLASIPLWLAFDWVNFSFLHAWSYHGLAEERLHRWLGFAFAFGAIGPAMFLAAEAIRRFGPGEIRWRRIGIPPAVHPVLAVLGLLCLLFPLAVRAPVGSVTLWLGVALLLDPINLRLGVPSLLGDWARGRYGRTLWLMAGGLVCGLLWEFWNYWAVAKWTYDLPFLGALERVRYFEMPLPGLAGFLPFALEFWVAFQTVAWSARRIGLRIEAVSDTDIL